MISIDIDKKNQIILNEYNDFYDLENKNHSKGIVICNLYKNNFNVPYGIIITEENIKKIIDFKFNIDNIIHKYLKSSAYAVRSSANVEDSKEYSWAGCFDSYLEIPSNQLTSKILECYNSKYNDRVNFYKKINNINTPINMNILSQKYIPGEYSGVCFSINPMTGDKNEIIIDIQKNKSGNVVSGKGESITIIYDKILKRTINQVSIRNEIIDLIINNIIDVNKIFNYPIDVEFVITNNEFIFTQVRPITTNIN